MLLLYLQHRYMWIIQMHVNHDNEHGDDDLTVKNTVLLHGFSFGWLGLSIRSWGSCWASVKFQTVCMYFSTSLPATASSSSQDTSLVYTPHTTNTPQSIYITHTYCIHTYHIHIHTTYTPDTHYIHIHTTYYTHTTIYIHHTHILYTYIHTTYTPDTRHIDHRHTHFTSKTQPCWLQLRLVHVYKTLWSEMETPPK